MFVWYVGCHFIDPGDEEHLRQGTSLDVCGLLHESRTTWIGECIGKV